MGVTAGELCSRYPRLYHMAWEGSWATINKYGLLSTSSLVDLYGITGEERNVIESRHRPKSVTIHREGFPPVVIRDQHPMSESALRRALIGGMEPHEWYLLLNTRVFFWLTEDRLSRMLNSPPYVNLGHTIIVLDSAPLVKDYWPKIWLAPMNTGCTVPFAHPRGKDTFQSPENYPWEQRKRLGKDAVVELTIEGGVREIEKYLVSVEHRPARGMPGQLSLW